jgi:hypothetical protein
MSNAMVLGLFVQNCTGPWCKSVLRNGAPLGTGGLGSLVQTAKPIVPDYEREPMSNTMVLGLFVQNVHKSMRARRFCETKPI